MCTANLPKSVREHTMISGFVPKVASKTPTPVDTPIDSTVTPVADAPIRKVSRRNRLGIGGGSGSGLSVPL